MFFFEIANVPVHIGLQWKTMAEARNCPKGDIRLFCCRECGFIANSAFDPSQLRYSEEYDNSLHFSPRFQEYARSLAIHLIDRYDIRNKQVVEIGCGGGEFLSLLCELGHNRGVGFDPGPGRGSGNVSGNITFIRDYYSSKYSSYKGDLTCCRYVLEHVPDPVAFMAAVRETIGDGTDTMLYVEVPDVSLILKELSVWDVIYEHRSYFCRQALETLLHATGFDVVEAREGFDGQFLGIVASPRRIGASGTAGTCADAKWIGEAAHAFSDNYQRRMETWSKRLAAFAATGKRVVVWGAGAKGVSFMNLLKVEDQITYVVDINPRKQGMFVPGTGQQIVSPGFLADYNPECIIVMNPIYTREIEHQLAGLGLKIPMIVA